MTDRKLTIVGLGGSLARVSRSRAALQIVDRDGQIQDRAVELQLRTLGAEVVRMGQRFAADDSVQLEAACKDAAERVAAAAGAVRAPT